MSSVIKVKRRITGATGAPGTGVEGEIAVNFAGGAGATPEFYAHGGALGWLRVNPPANITTQSVNLGTAADIGTAYTAWAVPAANKLTGNVIIATFTPTGGVAGAYVLTNPAAPGVATSWTSLGGAVAFADATATVTGTSLTQAINPAALAGASVNGSTVPANTDAGKWVRVSSNGKIAAALLPVDAVNIKGSIAATAAAPAGAVKGDSYFISTPGVFPAGWTGIATQTAKSGDRVLFDGTNWHLIPSSADLAAYLPLAGGSMAATGNITFTASAALATRLDGSDPTKSAIDGFTIDMGTY